MPKQAKTKKQKKLTDLRRKSEFYTLPTNNSTAIKKVAKTVIIEQSFDQVPILNPVNTSAHHYQYLRPDLFRTIFLTGSIAVTQLIIYFLIFKR